jgi:hypothetical protein
MVSNKSFVCEICGYSSNRKYNLELHQRSPNACDKRLNRLNNETSNNKVNLNDKKVNPFDNKVSPKVNPDDKKVSPKVNPDDKSLNNCKYCNQIFSSKSYLMKHEKKCNGLNSLQCPTCKKMFGSKQSKYKHMKNVKCELVLTEEQQRIKELEEGKKKLEEELKENKKQLEEARSRPTTIYNTTNNNNYFDHSINYNNYDNLSVDHITKDDIKRLFNNCRMQYPELSEDLTRMILKPKENQCIYLPEGQKSNTCAVIKDGIEMRKPLIRVLNDLGVQTAILIRDSDVIERNKKDIVSNQFWADNRNACGLNISDIEYMTDNDKEIAQRNKNIVLDMCEGKIE